MNHEAKYQTKQIGEIKDERIANRMIYASAFKFNITNFGMLEYSKIPRELKRILGVEDNIPIEYIGKNCLLWEVIQYKKIMIGDNVEWIRFPIGFCWNKTQYLDENNNVKYSWRGELYKIGCLPV